MKLQVLILIIVFFGCNYPIQENSFSWKNKMQDFVFQNKDEFVIDSVLNVKYKTYKTVKHPLINSILRDSVFLYSWQNRDKEKTEFTVIRDDGELGLKIFYIILDKKDSLLSYKQIGGKGSEGGFLYETRSRFINKDTILTISSTTQFFDFVKMKRLEQKKGDTTFSYLSITNDGKILETVLNKGANFKEN